MVQDPANCEEQHAESNDVLADPESVLGQVQVDSRQFSLLYRDEEELDARDASCTQRDGHQRYDPSGSRPMGRARRHQCPDRLPIQVPPYGDENHSDPSQQ